MWIGELASAAGVRPSAIRFYEQAGLIPAPKRRAGRRCYPPAALDRLLLIGRAKAAGFRLEDIRRLVEAEGFSVRERWSELIRQKTAELDGELRDLTRKREVFSNLAGCECEDVAECARRLRANPAL